MKHALRGSLTYATGLVLAVVWAAPLYAQDAPAEAPADSATAWMTEATGQVSFVQAGFQNWQEGGVNSLAFSTGLNGKASRTAGRWTQSHDVRLAFGLIKQDSLEVRKAEDLIQILSAFTYLGQGFFARFHPTFAAGLRTQFAEGFDYGQEPEERVSAFFAPATLTQSIGLTYMPTEWFTQRVGLGAKETVVTIESLRERYGVDSTETVRFEAGLEAFTEVNKGIAENVLYTSKLSLFASFNQPDKPDALWENLITMKVNKWLNVNFEYVALYDLDIVDEVQMKEVFSLGVSFILL